MCGIAGFVGRGDRRDLARMTAAIAHRGPDGEGVFICGETGVHLGHRRLAILDLELGHQPMWNEDNTVGIIFNGEIYNHGALRQELERQGHMFRTDHSDTEVLVHAYEQWGDLFPERLNGMFAFAIFDLRRRRLLLARDRFGEKPLYYTSGPDFLAFASELTAIAAHSAFVAQISRKSVQKLLGYGFIPGDGTILEGAMKLPAGSILIHDLRDRSNILRRYWQFSLEPDKGMSERAEGELAEELRALLFEATRRRLISDVPLGLFLSGGIDSSAVLAGVASSVPADRIRSFTIGFTEPSFDESAKARAIAATFGCRNDVEVLDFETALAVVPDLLGRLDEPIADASILPTYLLSRFTRRHVTVALSGDGGDELLAGYDPFVALPWARLYRACTPRPLHEVLKRGVGLLPHSDRNMSLDFKLRRTLSGLSFGPELWNPVWLSAAEPGFLRDLLEDCVAPEDLYSEAVALWNRDPRKSILARSLEYYTTFYLTDDILTKVDRASMLNSLETRAVFLDNDVVDFCRRLPDHFKFRKGRRKVLLRRALEGVLPCDILEMPKKGFGIPLAKWLRHAPVPTDFHVVPGVRSSVMHTALNDHRAGKSDHRHLIWAWLALSGYARHLGKIAGAAKEAIA